ncbi:MAG: hypothetical protein KHY46_09095 [Clostridiales bacterium]|nr:hypothetical protein [Clostridiales bacterium]
MARRGEITIFLSMVLLSICTLLCGLAESARTAGARLYLRTALDSSMDSLMAQYHRGLWKQYRILGLEHEDKEMLEEELSAFLAPYMEASNWYPMEVSQASAEDVVLLTQGNGRYLEEEILDYMRYGLVGVLWDEMDENGAGELLGALKEAGSISQVSGFYEGHTKEAVRLEKALEAIHSCLEEQNDRWQRADGELADLDGGGFIREGERMQRQLERIPGLVSSYERQADRLAQALAESRRDFEGREDLSPSVREGLEEEIRQYEAYTAEDGERRQEVAALTEMSRENRSFIQGTIEEAESVMEYIADWEPSDEDDELDEEALWRPVQRRWRRYPKLSLGIKFGVADKEKEGFLEQVGAMARQGFLELVVPEGAVVSGRTLELLDCPSGSRSDDGPEGDSGERGILERLIIGEYGIRFFRSFQKESSQDGQYELEYLIQGEKKDRDNLSGTVARLLAVREGLNLVHILSDSGKRQEARTLAAAIAGGTGILPLVSILTFFIMCIWALGESLMDVRRLLDGERVPLIKEAGDWSLSLEGLLEMGKTRTLAGTGDGAEGKGLDYKGYLRLLLFAGYEQDTAYRMMDMMQLNIRKEQPGFRLERCAWKVDMKLLASGKHVFFGLGLWKNREGQTAPYDTAMTVSGSY